MEALQEYQQVATSEKRQERFVLVLKEHFPAFLKHLEEKGTTAESIRLYQYNLDALYDALPENKQIRRGTLARWREKLLEEGYSSHTVNSRISVANSFLNYLNMRDLQLLGPLQRADNSKPQINRGEYIRMLQTARNLGNERIYLLVKVFATTGIPPGSIDKLTVASVEQGNFTVLQNKNILPIRIPSYLQKELLDYAQRNGIVKGAIFITRAGKPLKSINELFRSLCRQAYVPENIGTPRELQKLYRETQHSIEENARLLIEQSYDRLLESEQILAGWNKRK